MGWLCQSYPLPCLRPKGAEGQMGRGSLGIVAIAIGIAIAIERLLWIPIPTGGKDTTLSVAAPVPEREKGGTIRHVAEGQMSRGGSPSRR